MPAILYLFVLFRLAVIYVSEKNTQCFSLYVRIPHLLFIGLKQVSWNLCSNQWTAFIIIVISAAFWNNSTLGRALLLISLVLLHHLHVL